VSIFVAQRLLSDGLFDLVVTSPPYNIGKGYEAVLSINDYIHWTRRWVGETCRRLLSAEGALLLNLGYIPPIQEGVPHRFPICYGIKYLCTSIRKLCGITRQALLVKTT
jgi:DNA modification methylase